MKKIALILFIAIAVIFFSPFVFANKLPIPSDTIVGLYYPFRDYFAKDYPNGIPFKNFLITDPVRQQYPWRQLAVSAEKNLQLPLWNPYNMTGTPLFANFQTGALYPLNILFLFFSFPISWSLLIVLQPILAGIFVYLYLNNLRLNKFACFLAGFTFAFCGFSTAWMEWGTIVNTALWLPLMLLCIDKIFAIFEVWKNSKLKTQNSKIQLKNRKLTLWSLIFIFSLTSSFFAGHLQTFFYLFVTTLAYLLGRWWQYGKSKRTFLFYGLSLIIFALLAAVQWIPTLQFIFLSARNIDQNWQQAGWFIPWQNLVQFIAPDFFGNPTTLNYWGVWNYAEFVGYIGIFPFIMAFFAVLQRRDKKTLFFGLLFLISLFFSLPTIFARLPFQLQIPFLSGAQPTRLLFLTDFSLAILAGLGFDILIHQEKKANVFYPVLFVAFLFGLLWSYILIFHKSLFPISPENLTVAKHNLYLPTLIFFICALLIGAFVFFKNKKLQQSIIVLLLLVSLVDILRFSNKFTPFTNPFYLFPTTRALAFLKNQPGTFRIMADDSRILPPNFSIMYRLQSVDGYDPLYLLRYGELIIAMERGKPDIAPPFGFNRIITPQNVNSPIINLLSVKYILSLRDIKSPTLKKVFSEGQTSVYQNLSVYPRTYFVKNTLPVSSKQDAISALFNPSINLRQTAVVENFDVSEKNFGEGSANIVEYNEEKVVIAVKNTDKGFLVLTDSYYPSWHVTICSEDQTDCQAAKIYVTDYNFRGVLVPAGNHTIVFHDNLL